MAKKYFCEVCGDPFRTKKSAEECARKRSEGVDLDSRTRTRAIGTRVLVFMPLIDEKGKSYHLVGYVIGRKYKTLTEQQLREQFHYERPHRLFDRRQKIHNLVYTVSTRRDAKDGKEFLADQLQTAWERAGRRRNFDRPF